jgi:hypothetical protein
MPTKNSESHSTHPEVRRLTREEAEQKLQLAVLDALIYSPMSVPEIGAVCAEILADAISIATETDFPEISNENGPVVLWDQMSKCEFVTTETIQ